MNSTLWQASRKATAALALAGCWPLGVTTSGVKKRPSPLGKTARWRARTSASFLRSRASSDCAAAGAAMA